MDEERAQEAIGDDVPEDIRLHVVIVTGDQLVYDGSAERVIAPLVRGQISILVHHAPLLAALDPGELVVRGPDSEDDFAVGGGFLEVLDNQVTVLADTIERATEIDVQRAEAARRKARLLMHQYQGRPEYAVASQALRRSRARLKVAGRLRRSGPANR